MKNPFIKEKNSDGIWIAAAVTSLIAAGALAWLAVKRAAARAAHDEHALDYLKPKPAKHKKTTDVHDLHVIATH